MKILEVIGGEYAGGGQEAFAINLTESLQMQHLDVDCLIPYTVPPSEMEKIQCRLHGRMHSLNVSFSSQKSVNEIYKPFLIFLKSNNYDIVHIHSSRITMMSMLALACKKAKVNRVFVHSHNAEEKESIRHLLLRFIGSILMSQNVDTYLACSQAAAEWKFAPKYARKAVIINNGIIVDRYAYDPFKRKEWRAKLDIADNIYVIGHVGRLTYQKNHVFLVHIFKEILLKEPNCLLLLVGDGEERDSIRQLIDDYNIGNKVVMAGNVDNTQDYYQVMDVFVLPSRFEGLPLTAVEAQTAGLPVVASNNITEKMKLTPEVFFLDLGVGATSWADEILKMKGSIRKDNSKRIRAAGYDSVYTTDTIRKLYF